MKETIRHCVICGSQFEASTSWHKYCSIPCKSLRYRELNNPPTQRYCRQCGVGFVLAAQEGNKQHCSVECSRKSARESRSKFWERNGTKKRKAYYKKSREKLGPDSNLKRFYARNPDSPKACESCGEYRVLDIAHKPGHERNGSWRSAKNTTPEKVWILCPTCHALLDRMGYLPKELGLKGGDANA